MIPGARLIILGRQGSGKGTQCVRLSRHFVVPHISTGDMLRAQVAAGTPLGAEAKSFMDAGKLVPDQVIIAMVQARIAEPDAREAWILDGFPRTLPQAQALDGTLSGASAVSHVIYFDVPESVLVGRLTGRRTCGKCGAIWHVDNHPTKVADVCDNCGGGLVQRSDDRLEAITQRLEQYRTLTAPLLAYYRERGVLREIDANRSPSVVYEELLNLMQ